MQNEIDKLYSEEVEQNILGCMLVFEESVKYVKTIEENDFFLDIHKKIFSIIRELGEQNSPVDLISVKELAKSKKMDEKKIFSYLIKITSNIITSTNIEYYISKLKNYSIRRSIIRKSQKIINDMYQVNSDINAEEIKKNVIQTITEIKTNDKLSEEDCNMLNVMTETLQDIDNKYNKRDDHRYETGFFELDKVTDGLHEQELTLIAARPRHW